MANKGSFIPIEQRLLKYRRIDEQNCWNWTGAIVNGYGHIGIRIGDKTKNKKVHRVAYEHWVKPIPEGLTIDHLCRNTRCFNPDHLEPVTMAVNVRRGTSPSAKNRWKTHCIRGHEYSPDNTYVPPNGQRVCRTCRADREVQQRSLRRTERSSKTPAKKTLEERIMSMVSKVDDHWIWTGYATHSGPVVANDGTKVLVRRWAASQAGLELSRKVAVVPGCRREDCVRPEHMATKTRSEVLSAVKFREVCVNGHSLAGDNLYFDTKGYRACRQCQRDAKAPGCRTCGQKWIAELTVRAADGRRQCLACRPPKS